MDLYSPDCTVLHYMLGRKVFSNYSVQIRMKTEYINKVTLYVLAFLCVVVRMDAAFSTLCAFASFVYQLKMF